jgi:uncharacterized RmlC-like cupin family protein
MPTRYRIFIHSAPARIVAGGITSASESTTKKRSTQMSDTTDLHAPVEGHDGIFVIRAGKNCRDWNGIHYQVGLSGKNVSAKALSMNLATIPPGGVAYAHIHVGFEVMLYILSGRVRHEYGEGLKQIVENTGGDFIFIEPGVPHEVFNVSDTEPVVAVVARSDPGEWQNIIPYKRP